MSNVRLAIAGRSYTVACAPGEEEHVAELGRMIDGRIAAQPNIAGQSEHLRLLYAALLLADELHEKKAPRPADTAHDDIAAPASAPDEVATQVLEALAERLERMADTLEAAETRAGA